MSTIDMPNKILYEYSSLGLSEQEKTKYFTLLELVNTVSVSTLCGHGHPRWQGNPPPLPENQSSTKKSKKYLKMEWVGFQIHSNQIDFFSQMNFCTSITHLKV